MPLRLPPYSFFSRNPGDDPSTDPTASASSGDVNSVGAPAFPQELNTPSSDVLAVAPHPAASQAIPDSAAPVLEPSLSMEAKAVEVAPLAMPFVSVDGTTSPANSNTPGAPSADTTKTFYGPINAPQPVDPIGNLTVDTQSVSQAFSSPAETELTMPSSPILPTTDIAVAVADVPAASPTPAELSPTASALGINGFGRIGRTAFRVWWNRFREKTPLKVINTSGSSDLATWAHLLKYDSNYGVFSPEITVQEKQKKDQVSDADPELGTLTIDGHTITVLAQRDPAKIPWGKYGVTTVIESTGKFVTPESAGGHLQGGATRVVVSAPPKGEGEKGGMEMTLLGVQTTLPSGQIVSNASCTTNCVAPVAAIMQETFGVEKAMLTTIHAYTDDQNLHDNSHKDLRRARSAAQNIVPTSTGAAKSVGAVIPELSGRFDGLAVRVPVAVGSLSDMVFVTARPTTVEEVNAAFTSAAKTPRWQGILAVTTDPIVSHDIVGRSESSIVDLNLTQVVGGNLVKVVSWYDNEFGYCNRLVEVAV